MGSPSRIIDHQGSAGEHRGTRAGLTFLWTPGLTDRLTIHGTHRTRKARHKEKRSHQGTPPASPPALLAEKFEGKALFENLKGF